MRPLRQNIFKLQIIPKQHFSKASGIIFILLQNKTSHSLHIYCLEVYTLIYYIYIMTLELLQSKCL